MRHGNLPDGGHDKITWKRSRDLLTRRHDSVTLRRGGDVPQRRQLVFHLRLTGDVVGTYSWDVVDTCPWDVLGTYQWDVVGCFIWDLFEKSWRRTDKASLLRPLETSSRRSNKMSRRRTTETSWWRSIETSLGVSFETYLRRRWDVQRDVVTTLRRCLVAGWGFMKKATVLFFPLILTDIWSIEMLKFLSSRNIWSKVVYSKVKFGLSSFDILHLIAFKFGWFLFFEIPASLRSKRFKLKPFVFFIREVYNN